MNDEPRKPPRDLMQALIDSLPGPRCPVHTGQREPCPTCSAYIAAGL